MKIGILGGTFNPPHIAHLIAAECALADLGLDRIVFVPSFVSPHKKMGEEKLAQHRLQMVRLATVGNPRFIVSNVEIERRGTSFTYKTLEAFRQLHPDAELFLLMGADNYREIKSWRNPERIASLATIVVMSRPSFSTRRRMRGTKVRFVEIPELAVSSSEIRRRISAGLSVRYLVPDSILKYISAHRLYRS